MGAMIRFEGDGFRPYSLMLERFAENVSNAEPMFDALATEFGKSNLEQFGTAGRHYGTPWAPLSARYAAWKDRVYPGRPLMIREGLLAESLTERPFGIDEVWDKGMVVGTGVPYARFHQDGTEHMPARPLIGEPSRADRKVYAKTLHNWIVEGKVSV